MASPSSVAVAHAHPGRVRLKMPRIKEDPGFGSKVEQLFASVPAIRRAEANPLTGSLLLLYDPETIASAESMEALEPVADSLSSDVPDLELKDLAVWLSELTKGPKPRAGRNPGGNPGSRRAPVKGRGLRLLIPATLAGLGVHALVTAPTPIPWHNLMWMAFSSYFTLNRSSGPESGPPTESP